MHNGERDDRICSKVSGGSSDSKVRPIVNLTPGVWMRIVCGDVRPGRNRSAEVPSIFVHAVHLESASLCEVPSEPFSHPTMQGQGCPAPCVSQRFDCSPHSHQMQIDANSCRPKAEIR